jgi:hypothetical protein
VCEKNFAAGAEATVKGGGRVVVRGGKSGGERLWSV